MLKKLLYRNAKRQAKEYLLFLVTMVVAVALLYSFNSFIFSDTFTQLMLLLSESGEAGTIDNVLFYSFAMVLVIGWLVSYMINFMLQKRSKELGTYLLLGIEKKKIALMYVGENCMIGFFALILGCMFGTLISGFLEAIITHLYSGNYSLSLRISLKASWLTIIYFTLIYIISLYFSGHKLRKMKLIDLIYYEKYNENPHIKNSIIGFIIFCISIICGIGSIAVFFIQPSGGNGDIILGFILISLCSFGVFIGVSPIMNNRLEKNKNWKYKNSKMFIYRIFTAKTRKMSLGFGFITTLFTIAMVMISGGVSYGISVNKLTELNPFDLMILHMEEEYDFSPYSNYIAETASIEVSHSYNLYTRHEKDLISVRNDTLRDYFLYRKIQLVPEEYLYTENQYDTYMKYSDYCALREILGLSPVEMNSNEFIIQCMPYLKAGIEEYMNGKYDAYVSDAGLTCAGIYSENFSQYDGYGNGQELMIVVPDNLVKNMSVLYSLFVADLGQSVDLEYLNNFQNHFTSLGMIDVNFIEGNTIGDENYMTRLFSNAEAYLSGRYVIFAKRAEISLILSLIYVGLILCIVGTVVLAVHLLSDNKSNMARYDIIKILGMDNIRLKRMLKKQVTLYFAFSALPILVLSIGLVYTVANLIFKEYFLVPVFISTSLPTTAVFMITIMTFLFIYGIYGFISYSIIKRNILT